MSNYERIGDNQQFDVHNKLYESFRQATVRDICNSLDKTDTSRDICRCACSLAELGCHEALPYLDSARQAVMADLTEEQRYDASEISEGYASLGRFDIALDMMDALDSDDPRQAGRRTHREILFYFNTEKIPEVYLETALQTYLKSGYTKNTYTNIYLLGERQPAIRPRALQVMEQLAFEHLLSNESEQWQREEHLKLLVESAGAWGYIDTAKQWQQKFETVAWKLGAELSVAKTSGIFIDHGDSQALYDDVLANPEYSDANRAWMLRSLQSMGYTINPALVRHYIKNIDDREEQIQQFIEHIKVFDDKVALQDVSELVTTDDIRDRSYLLLGHVKPVPGLLAANAYKILSTFLDEPDENSRLDIKYMAGRLIEDFIIVGEIPEAMDVARVCRDRGMFDRYDYGRLQRKFVTVIAQKGRASFDEAYTQMAAYVSESPDNAYLQSSLLSSLTVAAYDYLTPEEREYYFQACDKSLLFRDWLKLAESHKRLDLLVIARQYVDEPENRGEEYMYRSNLVDILKAYNKITSSEVSL